MKKRIFRIPLFLLALAFSSVVSHAQMQQTRIYSQSNRNELITKIRTLSDGSSVMAGYIYDISGSSAVNGDMILLRVRPNGTILWQKQFGTAGSNAMDLINGMTVTSNDDIIVVGTVGRSSVYVNNTAAIFRFNSSGTLLWSNFVRKNPGINSPGDVFNDVAELSNGNIIAVGSDEFAPGSSKSMICYFNGGGTLLYNETFDRNSSDDFLGVCASGTDAVITGWFDKTYKDSRILLYRPGTTSGTIVWDNSYDLTGAMNSAGTNFTDDGLTSVFIRGNRIVANGHQAARFGFVPNMQGVFECDLATGTNPSLRSIYTNGLAYSNNVALYPVDDQRFFISQTPASSFIDATFWTNPAFTNSVVAEVRPFQPGGQVVQSKEFNLPGNQSIFDIDMKNSLLYLGGCTNATNGTTDNDIYFVVSSQTLTNPNQTCDLPDRPITVTLPTLLTSSATETRANFGNNNIYSISFSDPGLLSETLCGETPTGGGGGEETDCSLQCYWRVDGNNAISSQHVLGTLNNEDIRMVTNGTQRAVLERQFGNFGLNTPAPTARLHVLCAPSSPGLSDVRFENLSYGTGQALVIDGAGYVRRSDRLQGREATTATLDSLTGVISQLQKDVAYLMAAARQPATDAATDIRLYPNPAGNYVSLEVNGSVNLDDSYVQITDVSGKTLISQKVPAEEGRNIRINTSLLMPGSYFVKLLTRDKVIAVKNLIIQK